ncbi:GNAT family N-acetyltransferase [Acidithiobacillus montserratensis]|uniref:GNAT family N-acetyltransferase n=1 Tax=Acidithiobacillus montserratensis TaxID=2729135 RepID=A0ACD5HI76_9PROT|nr:GNAT family N-acetyltransferase [Acidithiobacillus montserratensis]MBU2747831.1 GNAT family N-acetyltransferase [Acidithiobacillus montserratensis]
MDKEIQIHSVEFLDERPLLERIRIQVFVEEQGVPEYLEMDDRDEFCLHFLAFCDGLAVGTARLDLGLNGKVGRLAVLQPYRGRGVGKSLMAFLHQSAWDLGLTGVWCHAQLSAKGFYAQMGYTGEGAVFQEAGIDHIAMRCIKH